MQLNLNHEERVQLSLLIMEIMQDWRLSSDEQLALLGMPAETKPRELTRLRHGAAFPEDEVMVDRARHMVGIQQSLHRTFPNKSMPAHWLRTRNRALTAIPLDVMLDEGVPGMHRIWRHLDCTIDWD